MFVRYVFTQRWRMELREDMYWLWLRPWFIGYGLLIMRLLHISEAHCNAQPELVLLALFCMQAMAGASPRDAPKAPSAL
jgi:hypothetical protein